MSADNPYRAMVSGYAELLKAGAVPVDNLRPGERPRPKPEAGKALIFAPHPDDECVIGGLPLRLLRELEIDVAVVAVTQGSRKERQAERLQELRRACDHLGFGVRATAENGLENINLTTREQKPEIWAAAVAVIVEILATQMPTAIFVPHDRDWHRTHIGTHYLLADALARMSSDFACHVVETEFWGALVTPNLMVESSIEDVADLVAALSLHAGEVARNRYHLRLPAWMIDNVRRGSELVQGEGKAAPDFTFATLYRLRRWAKRRLRQELDRGRLLGRSDDLSTLFA